MIIKQLGQMPMSKLYDICNEIDTISFFISKIFSLDVLNELHDFDMNVKLAAGSLFHIYIYYTTGC